VLLVRSGGQPSDGATCRNLGICAGGSYVSLTVSKYGVPTFHDLFGYGKQMSKKDQCIICIYVTPD